jgi:2-oxo-3-(phosphooxy)propyl 3-oxoalkanoate synthase
VVIRGYTATGQRASAFLDPGCYRNRSMFDHPYDHVTAMVLTEAARQLLLVAAGANTARVRGLAGRFTAFAELDSPVRLDAAPTGGAGPVEVVLTQAERPVAEISITVE